MCKGYSANFLDV